MDKKKIKILITILLIIIFIIAFICIRKVIINKYNKTYIENYVQENYKDYSIENKSYEYLDNFWSAYYDIAEDDINLEIVCNTTLKNNKTGMYVAIPFYHNKYGIFRDSQYNRKDMKILVEEYEIYWKSINKVSETYNVDIKVSVAELGESSTSDIYELTIYVIDSNNAQKIINDINEIKTKIDIKNINYVVARDDIYQKLSPWIEPNKNIIVPNGMTKINRSDKYGLYIESYEDGKHTYTTYYA